MKRKILILCIMFTVSLAGNPPIDKHVIILKSDPINPYLKLWQAVCSVETGCNPLAYNQRELATGIAQIRPILIKDYNQQTGKRFKLQNMFNPDSSKIVFMHYATKWHYNQAEQISRTWNGGQAGMSKESTKQYYSDILSKLESL